MLGDYSIGTEFNRINKILDELKDMGKLSYLDIHAEGYHSNAEESGVVIAPTHVLEWMGENDHLNFVVFELDGKHSEVTADTRLETLKGVRNDFNKVLFESETTDIYELDDLKNEVMSESFALNLIDYFEWILDKEGTLTYEEELTKDYYKEVKKIQENTFDVVYITLNYVKHLSKNISKEDKELELYKKYIYDNIEGVAKELKAMDDESGTKRI